MRTASHLAHEPLLLHLAAEFPKRLLKLLGILDDYSHNPTRIPIEGRRCSVKSLLEDVRANRPDNRYGGERDCEGADHHQGVGCVNRHERGRESPPGVVAGLDQV